MYYVFGAIFLFDIIYNRFNYNIQNLTAITPMPTPIITEEEIRDTVRGALQNLIVEPIVRTIALQNTEPMKATCRPYPHEDVSDEPIGEYGAAVPLNLDVPADAL